MSPKCSICKARSQDSGYYRNRFLCPECQYEYKAIFDGWQSNSSKKASKHLKAWEAEYERSWNLWDGFFNKIQKPKGYWAVSEGTSSEWIYPNEQKNDGVGSE